MEKNVIEKGHNVGDPHPSKPWVWTEYKPGKFDWRPVKAGSKTTTQAASAGSEKSTPAEKTDVKLKSVFQTNGYRMFLVKAVRYIIVQLIVVYMAIRQRWMTPS